MLTKDHLWGLMILIPLAALNLLAEGKHSPENASFILILGGGAVTAWHYVRARLGR